MGVQAPPAPADQPEPQSDETSDPEAANAAQLEEWFASRTREQLEEMCKTYQVPEADAEAVSSESEQSAREAGQALGCAGQAKGAAASAGVKLRPQPQEETGMGRPDVQSS